MFVVFEFKILKMKTFEQWIKEQNADMIQQHGDEVMSVIRYSLNDVIKWVELWQECEQCNVVRSACSHRYATLVNNGRGLMQCSDCGKVF